MSTRSSSGSRTREEEGMRVGRLAVSCAEGRVGGREGKR